MSDRLEVRCAISSVLWGSWDTGWAVLRSAPGRHEAKDRDCGKRGVKDRHAHRRRRHVRSEHQAGGQMTRQRRL